MYDDIIVSPYVEGYFAIANKTRHILEVGATRIQADYVMKCDDDTYVRIDRILRVLHFFFPFFFFFFFLLIQALFTHSCVQLGTGEAAQGRARSRNHLNVRCAHSRHQKQVVHARVGMGREIVSSLPSWSRLRHLQRSRPSHRSVLEQQCESRYNKNSNVFYLKIGGKKKSIGNKGATVGRCEHRDVDSPCQE